ncbi:II family cellulose-binding protein [Malaciobacter halophilus]|uniref:II family cellulose-binding protein n=1 Tax=Malaciobacter halophilus TaxID=197482 RepID=A0A2N1J428_9BACT|nr:II family cellulose-binding protein [Malaciobacter halophilus]
MAITTPALLFPAISLLLLAYTNRFLTTGQLIRGLSANARDGMVPKASKQIKSLKKRVSLIRQMQIYGVLSLILCTLSMFLLFLELNFLGEILFGLSLIAMTISLFIALFEISISVNAINYELEGIKRFSKSHKKEKRKEEHEQEEELEL